MRYKPRGQERADKVREKRIKMKVFVYDKKHSKQVAVLTKVIKAEYDKSSGFTTLISENGDRHLWDKRQYKITMYQN